MPIPVETDLVALFAAADFTVPVVYNGQSTTGLLYAQETVDLNGVVIQQNETERSVLVRTASLTGLAIGTGATAITVDGVGYTVRDVRLEAPDGRLTRVYLRG